MVVAAGVIEEAALQVVIIALQSAATFSDLLPAIITNPVFISCRTPGIKPAFATLASSPSWRNTGFESGETDAFASNLQGSAVRRVRQDAEQRDNPQIAGDRW